MNEKLEVVKDILKKYEQEHLLDFYNELSIKEKESLLNQIKEIDFKTMQELYESTKKKEETVENNIEPIQYSIKENLTEEEIDKYTKIGTEAIKEGKVAVCHMAGGQRNQTRA